MNPELAKRLIIEREKAKAPVPATQEELDYLALVQWTDGDQFTIYGVDDEIPPPTPASEL